MAKLAPVSTSDTKANATGECGIASSNAKTVVSSMSVMAIISGNEEATATPSKRCTETLAAPKTVAGLGKVAAVGSNYVSATEDID